MCLWMISNSLSYRDKFFTSEALWATSPLVDTNVLHRILSIPHWSQRMKTQHDCFLKWTLTIILPCCFFILALLILICSKCSLKQENILILCHFQVKGSYNKIFCFIIWNINLFCQTILWDSINNSKCEKVMNFYYCWIHVLERI